MPEHTIAENLQRLQTAKTAIGNAITAKGGTVGASDGLEEFASDIATIPSGGGGSQPRKDVNFYDYDGTIVNSYTAAEFAELSAMPSNPSHDGLTAQGWNWSLADAKTYVASCGKLEIGQMYITSDGKTRLYITLTEGRTSPYLYIYLKDNTEIDVDWGDGSAHSSLTTISAGYQYEQHKYTSNGDYIVTITVINGSFSIQNATNSMSQVLTERIGNINSPDRYYINSISKVELGTNVKLGSSAFRCCNNLKTITIPSTINAIDTYSFYLNYSLRALVVPNSVTSISLSNNSALSIIILPNTLTSLAAYAFQSNYSLRALTIPPLVTNINQYAFQGCNGLSTVVIPNSVNSIDVSAFLGCGSLVQVILPESVGNIKDSAFQNCYSLESIIIPNSVTSIGANAFNGCSYMNFIKFKSSTNLPIVSSANAWNGISTTTKILIPLNTYGLYTTAQNYPNSANYVYLVYGTYTSGEALPTTSTDNYNLTWYATIDDATSQTNPITLGNGDEVYARSTPIT